MVTQFMPGLGNSQFRDGQALSLIPTAEGGHTGGIRLKSQDHQVIDGTEIFACLCLGYIPVGSLTVCLGDFGTGDIQPGIGPLGTDLSFANRGEVLFHPSAVIPADFLIQFAYFFEIGVKHAALATESPALGTDSIFGFLEKISKDFLTASHGGQSDTVLCPGKGFSFVGNL